MGRYRPPAPKSSPYITRPGYEALQAELKVLWKRRTGVTRALAAAAAEGDRSENAEYIYRKKELREIDRRVHYLQKRLPELKVVAEPPTDRKRVFFGAWVTLEDEQGQECVYRVVGADEGLARDDLPNDLREWYTTARRDAETNLKRLERMRTDRPGKARRGAGRGKGAEE